MSYKNKFLLARELRKNQTPSEKELWRLIRYDQILGYNMLLLVLLLIFIALNFY